MTIHFACPCGRPFAVRNKRAGKVARCPDCGRMLTVPEKSGPSEQRRRKQAVRARAFRDTVAPVTPAHDADVDDDVTGGLAPEELGGGGDWRPAYAPEDFRRRRRRRAEPAPPQRPEPSAPPKTWRRTRITLLVIVLLVLIVANPYSVTNLKRLLVGQEPLDAAVVHNDRGVALDAANRLDDAIAEYREAIRLAPDLFEAHYNLGNSLDAAGRRREALAAFRTAVALNPDHVGASFGLGAALFKTRLFADAERELRNTLSMDANHAEAHLYLSYTLYQVGRYREALEELHVAADLGAHFHATYAQRLEAALAREERARTPDTAS